MGELFRITPELASIAEAPLRSRPVVRGKAPIRLQESRKRHDARESRSARWTRARRRARDIVFGEPLTESSYVDHVSRWLDDEKLHAHQLQVAAQYAAWAALTPAGREKHHHDVLFKLPRKLDPVHLIPSRPFSSRARRRFSCILRIGDSAKASGSPIQVPIFAARSIRRRYCIKCHNQDKDSCSTGLREKDGEFKKSVFGVTLNGCPLDEKISEMHVAKQDGNPIGALAIVTIDNPMCAGTGHRICNDCMKSCIYQKQDPVDIPQAETRTLKDVLELPWGFEIYSLLTRWNPLNIARPFPQSRHRLQGAGRRTWSRRLHAGASPDERRPHGRRPSMD